MGANFNIFFIKCYQHFYLFQKSSLSPCMYHNQPDSVEPPWNAVFLFQNPHKGHSIYYFSSLGVLVSFVGTKSAPYLTLTIVMIYEISCNHDDVIKWKYFPCYWLFVMGIYRWLMNSTHKGQWCRAFMFWVNNRDVSDLRCHCTHYDVTVMMINSIRRFDCYFSQNNSAQRLTGYVINSGLILEPCNHDSVSRKHISTFLEREFPFSHKKCNPDSLQGQIPGFLLPVSILLPVPSSL